MELKKFILIPDGHYGYPESVQGDTPRSHSELVKMYREAGYSGYNMGDGDSEEPDSDDYETEEEYQAAMKEWNEENNSNAEWIFNDYGNFDVFHNAYSMLCDPSVKPDDILESIFDYDSTSCHEDFMIEASKQEGVAYIMSSGHDDDIAISGEIFGTSESGGEAPKIISDVIVREYKEKNPQIGIIYSDVLKEMPEIEDIISSILSPEDMANLKNLGSGGSLLRTFGF